MDSSKRIIVNTFAQYGKSIINICLSLYSTRLVLAALNVNDYGIYSVVAGAVGVLGYLTNSLVVTTQRHLSFYHGTGDMRLVKTMFANSLLIHFIIGILTCAVLFVLKDFFINHFLNIAKNRLDEAGTVYSVMTLMLFITILTSPFKALLIARENIVYISVVEIADGVLKWLLAVSLTIIGLDRLLFYATGMMMVLLLNFAAFAIYTFSRYEESHVGKSMRILDWNSARQLLGFAWWTTYGMVAGMCQTQGLAIVLNKFFGTAINAAFGIASQVNGAIRFVSTSILNAMNPQIMKAEGNQDRGKMLALASKESKYSTALMMIVSIPIMAEMPAILEFWLKDVPHHTATFCQTLMLAFLIDQTTLGLHAANQATGKIKVYSLIMFTPKIMIVPLAWILLQYHHNITTTMLMYVAIELMVAAARLPFMKFSAGLHIGRYLQQVVLPLIPLLVAELSVSYFTISYIHAPYRFLMTIVCCVLIGAFTLFLFGMDSHERKYICNTLRTKNEQHED